MSLEPQWLVIISLLQKKNKNEYDSTVTKLWGDDAVNQWLKNPREGQDGIVVFESTNFQKKRSNEILRKTIPSCPSLGFFSHRLTASLPQSLVTVE